MKLHNIEQKSPEWHNLRLGKITASTFLNYSALTLFVINIYTTVLLKLSQENDEMLMR